MDPIEIQISVLRPPPTRPVAEPKTLWLSPDWVSFDRPITIKFNETRLALKQPIKPSQEVMLEDVRTRGDRQHPFSKVEQ
jgi:hypothetical protein